MSSESKARKKWKLLLIQEEHTESERFIDESLALRPWGSRSRFKVGADKGRAEGKWWCSWAGGCAGNPRAVPAPLLTVAYPRVPTLRFLKNGLRSERCWWSETMPWGLIPKGRAASQERAWRQGDENTHVHVGRISGRPVTHLSRPTTLIYAGGKVQRHVSLGLGFRTPDFPASSVFSPPET